MGEAPHPDWIVPEWDAPGVGALMTTRAGGSSAGAFTSMNLRDGLGDDPVAVLANHARFERAIGAVPVMIEQVHGTRVVRLRARDKRPGASVHVADASITTEPGLACVVQVADCLPVLLAAPGGVGAAHAGWRGLSSGVVEKTVAALCDITRCKPSDLRAWLGPCIGPQHYEVGVDVLRAFGADPGVEGDQPHFRVHGERKWLADLVGLARQRLQAAGVEAISGGRWCTYADASRFFSYRRDGVTGRMAAAVWLERG